MPTLTSATAADQLAALVTQVPTAVAPRALPHPAAFAASPALSLAAPALAPATRRPAARTHRSSFLEREAYRLEAAREDLAYAQDRMRFHERQARNGEANPLTLTLLDLQREEVAKCTREVARLTSARHRTSLWLTRLLRGEA